MRRVRLKQITSSSPDDAYKAWIFCNRLQKAADNGFLWPANLLHVDNFEQFLPELDALEAQNQPCQAELQQTSGDYIPQEHWWIFDEYDDLIGLSVIRTALTPLILNYGGRISIGLSPRRCGFGYGTLALKSLINRCWAEGLQTILLTSNVNNLAARRIIEKNNGKMTEIMKHDDKELAYYQIMR